MVPKERELEMGVGTRIENMTDSQGRGQGTNHWQDRDADPDLEKEGKPRDIPNRRKKPALPLLSHTFFKCSPCPN